MDAKTKETLYTVRVINVCTGETTYTDLNGKFLICNKDDENCALQFEPLGYENQVLIPGSAVNKQSLEVYLTELENLIVVTVNTVTIKPTKYSEPVTVETFQSITNGGDQAAKAVVGPAEE